MTAPAETTDDTTTTDETTDLDTTQTETPAGDGSGEGGKAMPRDQKMRLERNAARQERDALAARLEAMQTRELHRLLADTLANPEDISLSGLKLPDFIREEDGELDAEAVAEAAATVLASRPGLARDYRPKVGATDPSQALGNGRVNRQPTFADMLSG